MILYIKTCMMSGPKSQDEILVPMFELTGFVALCTGIAALIGAFGAFYQTRTGLAQTARKDSVALLEAQLARLDARLAAAQEKYDALYSKYESIASELATVKAENLTLKREASERDTEHENQLKERDVERNRMRERILHLEQLVGSSAPLPRRQRKEGL